MDEELGKRVWRLEEAGFTLFTWRRQADRTWINENMPDEGKTWRYEDEERE